MTLWANLLVTTGMGVAVLGLAPWSVAAPVTRTESFDRDPGWDGANNRPADRGDQPVEVRQDFGYTGTSHAGGAPGEIGGHVHAAAEPAWYAKVIS